jgi:periplasmic copper chaperone A
MKRILLAAAISGLACSAQAADYRAGPIEIKNPWTRATPQGAGIAAGYVVLVNRGPGSDRLVGGSFTGASSIELHSMSMEDGVMRMRAVPGGLEIKPGETVELKPNGVHMMFVGLKQQLQKGQTVKATLIFQNAGTAEVEFAVEGLGGPPAQHGGH